MKKKDEKFWIRKLLLSRQIFITIYLFLGIAVLFSSAQASEVEIKGLEMQVQDGEMLVSGRLEGVFNSNLEEIIEDGKPITITYIVELVNRKPYWLPKAQKHYQGNYTVYYDILKKQYRIEIKSKKKEEVLITEDGQEMKRLMTTLKDISMGEVKNLKKYFHYTIQAYAFKDPNPLPIPLKWLFPFLGDFETDWAEIHIDQDYVDRVGKPSD